MAAERSEGQVLRNDIDHPINIVYHFIIPVANYFIPSSFEVFRSLLIILFPIQMLSPIELYDQLQLNTAKVCYEWTYRMLSTKANSKLIILQPGP